MFATLKIGSCFKKISAKKIPTSGVDVPDPLGVLSIIQPETISIRRSIQFHGKNATSFNVQVLPVKWMKIFGISFMKIVSSKFW